MRRIYSFLLLLLCVSAIADTPEFHEGSNLAFIENKGQYITDGGDIADMVHFKADVQGLEFYITDKGLSYVFVKHNNDEYDPALGGEPTPDFEPTSDFARVDMRLLGANIDKNNAIMASPTKAKYNFYYAHCPDGIMGLSGYQMITYKDIYPNIDWVLYSKEGQNMKYEFIVHPGGDPADIKMFYQWADLDVSEHDITLSTPMGQIKETGLYAYLQETGEPVSAEFTRQRNLVKINTDAPTNKTLIIDPPLEWSTYWGGSGSEQPQALVASGNGKIFIGGYTNSTTYPTTNPGGGAYYQGVFAGGYDAFVASFDTSGVHIWSTYYGGSGNEGSTSYTGISIACGQGTDFWMVGTTTSSNLPLQNGGGGAYYQGALAGGYDFFIVKFDLNGVRKHATYFGGTSTDGGTSHGNGADCDASGNFYFSGRVLSSNFPLLNPGGGAYFDNTLNGSDDLCVVKLSSSGQLLWSTFLGGTSDDMNYSMDLHVDRTNNKLYVGTCTMSTNIPTMNPGGGAYFDNTQNGSGDMYLARFSLAGAMEWGTFIGGSGNEWLSMSISSAPDGDIAMITLTGSLNMPLVNPGGGAFFDNTHNGGTWDMYLCRFETNGAMSWSTYYGSSNNDHCQHNLTMDANGNIIMCGVSDGWAAPPTYNPGLPHFYVGTKDAQGTYCLVQYDPGGVMLWGTFFGGSGHDHLFGTVGGCIGVSAHSDIFVSAETTSPNLPMLDPGGGAYYKPVNSGGKEGFVTKFNNDINTILPIELLSFTGKKDGHVNDLSWKIASSQDVDRFELERDNGSSFEPIAVFKTQNNEYKFIDESPLNGTNYYRLKMFDINGMFRYSSVVAIQDIDDNIAVEIYPNPVTDNLVLSLQSDGKHKVKITATDILGQSVMQMTCIESGTMVLDVSTWRKGQYLFSVTDEKTGVQLYQNKLMKH